MVAYSGPAPLHPPGILDPGSSEPCATPRSTSEHRGPGSGGAQGAPATHRQKGVQIQASQCRGQTPPSYTKLLLVDSSFISSKCPELQACIVFPVLE